MGLTAQPPILSISDLEVSFARHRVLNGISLAVQAGESLGLVGESGSGKSTVLRAIAGLVARSHGRISLGGRDLKGERRDAHFCRTVQMIFQDPYGLLHPRHTVDAILSEPVAIHRLGNWEARISQALESVGLPSQVRYRFPHQLSGGQRQRIAIARALMVEPRLLLLDEPTSALDVSVQAEILNLLARLRQERGLTYVLVSHNMAVVARMCDRVAVMDHGQVAEELSRRDLIEGRAHSEAARLLIDTSRKSHTSRTADAAQTAASHAPYPVPLRAAE